MSRLIDGHFEHAAGLAATDDPAPRNTVVMSAIKLIMVFAGHAGTGLPRVYNLAPEYRRTGRGPGSHQTSQALGFRKPSDCGGFQWARS